jgi:hypothetical protein
MIAQHSKLFSGMVSAVIASLFWGFAFWRIFRSNPRSKVIECGSITIVLLLTMAFFSRVIDYPLWAVGLLCSLLILLCIVTLFFFLQEGIGEIRRRKGKSRKTDLPGEFPGAHS